MTTGLAAPPDIPPLLAAAARTRVSDPLLRAHLHRSAAGWSASALEQAFAQAIQGSPGSARADIDVDHPPPAGERMNPAVLPVSLGTSTAGRETVVDVAAVGNLVVETWPALAPLILQIGCWPWFADHRVWVTGGFVDAADVFGFSYAPTADALLHQLQQPRLLPVVAVVVGPVSARATAGLQAAVGEGTAVVLGPDLAGSRFQGVTPHRLTPAIFDQLIAGIL